MKRINIKRIVTGSAWLTIYLATGVAGGLVCWYFAARSIELWRYDPVWVSTAFLVILMVTGYIVPEIIERLQSWFGPANNRASKESWTKSIRILVSAILLPVAILVMANRYSWISSPLFSLPSDEYRLVTQVADTVMASGSSTTKVAGIEALGASPSKDSLAMLTKIVEQQPSILNDQNAYNALTKAIGSYGPQAKGWLLNLFQAHSQPAEAGTTLEGGAYERYFQPAFSDLHAEIKRAVADPTQQNDFLQKLAADESKLKSDLADLEAQQPVLESGDRTMDFVLETLASTKLTDDSDIYQLAKQVAGERAYGVGTRRRAILLVAQFGTQKDFAFLLPYLQDSDESLKAAALVAVKSLYQKSSPPKADSANK